MSFDLHLYKQINNKVIAQDITEYLNSSLPFNISEHSDQWYYSNPETGVYFIIENTEGELLEASPYFEEFTSLNFSIYINYLRPTYFGFEIFPLIEKMITDLDLYILNPQEESKLEEPHKFESGYLQNQWIEQNNKISKCLYKEYDLQYFTLEKSNYVWKYMNQRTYLQENLTDVIFVCGIFLIKNKSDNKIYTLSIWREHIPIVMPKVDYIIISKKIKKRFRTLEESGLVPYNTVMEKFKHYFKPFESDIPDIKILRPAESIKISKEFNNIKIWKMVEEFGTGVGKDEFVNIKP